MISIVSVGSQAYPHYSSEEFVDSVVYIIDSSYIICDLRRSKLSG